MNTNHLDEFSVTLLSNASVDIYSRNNVYEFSNVLENELHLPAAENWKFCVQSISLSNYMNSTHKDRRSLISKENVLINSWRKIKSEIKDGKITKGQQDVLLQTTYDKLHTILKHKTELFNKRNPIIVECMQVFPKFGTSKNIATFIANNTETFVTYEPTSEEYFSLNSPTITELSIRIKNSFDETLETTLAQPTVLVLKFKKMKYHSLEYQTIYINSGSEDPTDFHVRLPDNLLEDGKINPWEIALTSVNFVPLFKTFPTGIFHIAAIRNFEDFFTFLNNSTPSKWNTFFKNSEKGVQEFTYKDNVNADALYDFAKTIIENAAKKLGVIIFVTKKDPTKNERYMYIKPSEDIVLVLPENLIFCLGLDKPGIYYINGYGAIPFKKDKMVTATRHIDVSFMKPQNLLVYTDCVQPSYVGNVFAQYLTNVPLPQDKTKTGTDVPYITFEPKNLEFHPLQTGDLSNVRFKLLRTDGTKPEFAMNETVKLFMSIQFRRKK